MPSIRNTILLERLENLQSNLMEANKALDKLVESGQEFRISNEIKHADLENKTAAAHTRLDEAERRLADLSRALEKTAKVADSLMLQARVISWIGAFLGTCILALLWALLTGQAVVIFP